MRAVAFVVVGVVLGAAPARAETAEQLRARGEQYAMERRFAEAIVAFKAADRVEPRAQHACLIALAYIRRELLPQAEVFLEQCEKRATVSDPMPDWVPDAKRQLAERLASLQLAPVEILVEPAGATAQLTVSSFAPDEQFAPRTIHLAPGRHLITATAPGHADAHATIDVKDPSARRVVIRLQPENAPPPAPTSVPAPSKLPAFTLAAGGLLAMGGGVVHGFLFRAARNDMVDASMRADRPAYDEAETRFDRYRALSIGLYAAGAVVVGAGIYFMVTRRTATEPLVSVAPVGDSGGMVTIGWTR